VSRWEWLAVGLFAICLVPYWLWRFDFYGYPLPNTFYAKTGGGLNAVPRGLKYLWDFGRLNPSLSLGSLLAVGWWLKRLRRSPASPLTDPGPTPFVTLALAVSCGYAVYVVLIGGDFKQTFRFIIPFLPLWGILLDRVWQRLFRPGSQHRLHPQLLAWSLLVLVIIGSLVSLPQAIQWSRQRAYDLFCRTACGRYLAETAPPDAVLAIHSAGIIPYYSGLRTIDMWGLSDLHIARRQMPNLGRGTAGHEKYDTQYVFALKPDYFVPEGFFISPEPVPDVAARAFRGPASQYVLPDYQTKNVPMRTGPGPDGQLLYFNFLARIPLN
jgi:hypothetical protein